MNDVPSVLPSTGSDVDDVVGYADGVLVVFDHHNCVAEIAQMNERLNEAMIVTLMKTDRWLIKHVEDADKTRADLRRQPDTLRLATRECRRGARERQVVEADVTEELQSNVDLLEYTFGDHDVAIIEAQVLELLGRVRDRQCTQFAYVEPVNGDRERVRVKTSARAGIAGNETHVALDGVTSSI